MPIPPCESGIPDAAEEADESKVPQPPEQERCRDDPCTEVGKPDELCRGAKADAAEDQDAGHSQHCCDQESGYGTGPKRRLAVALR